MPVADCRGLVLWSVSASRSGANILAGAAFRMQVLMRNAVQLHVNHARTLICQGFSYMGSRERQFRASVSGGLVAALNAPIVQFGVRDFGFAITGGMSANQLTNC
jgi:hypothetical protein